uniref:Phosphatidylinositol-glycan biosynthesis class S protein n=1 Tax=Schistosoma mansoni TaxID=6183 RepID=A0A3Q0KUD6_SCHMA
MTMMMLNSHKSSQSKTFLDSYPELQAYQATSEEKCKTIMISIFYLLITILIGVPLWWKTTAPYHASLPYDEIQMLSSRKIEITVPITVLNFHAELDDQNLHQIGEIFTRFNLEQQAFTVTDGSDGILMNYHVNTRQMMNQLEIQTYTKSLSNDILSFWLTFENNLSSLNAFNIKDTPKSFENNHLIEQRRNNSSSVYHFLLLPMDNIDNLWLDGMNFNKSTTSSMKPFSIIRNLLHLNLIYIFIPQTIMSSKDSQLSKVLALHMKYLLDNVLIQTNHLMKLVRKYDNSINLSPGQYNEISKIIDKPLSVSSIYDVTVTVLTLDDSVSQLVEESNEISVWTNEMLINPIPWLKAHVGSAFKSWSPFVQVDFYSQRLYGVSAELLKKSQLSKTGNYTFYSQDDISNLINYLESFLGPPQTAYADSLDMARSNPGLHLILLLNTFKRNNSHAVDCPLPLRFHIPSYPSVVITDYALVPQWGGLISIDASDCMTRTGSTKIIAQKIIYVIRSILGFPQIKEMYFDRDIDNTHTYHIQSNMDLNGQTTNWELNLWFLRRTIECLTETKRTIESLINLLQRLPNMIIRDDVAHEVYHSCSNWSLALDNLKRPDETNDSASSHNEIMCSLGVTFQYAYNALISSNGAFFDHSLLGLLYFEDDQKYGIYTPLFVPIGFALFLSTYRTFKLVFRNNN